MPRRARAAGVGFVDAGRVQRFVLREDRPLEPAQLRSRIEAEFLGQDVAAVLEDAQRVGLPPGAIQGDHELAPESFAQRVRGDERFELDDRFAHVAELEFELDPFLDGLEPQLGQAGDRRLRELLVGEVGERVTPPQRLACGEQLRAPARVRCRQGRGRPSRGARSGGCPPRRRAGQGRSRRRA